MKTTSQIHKTYVTQHSYSFRLMLRISLSSSLYELNTNRIPYHSIGHEGPQGEQRYSSTLFLALGARRDEDLASRPGRFLTPGKTRYPLYRRLGGPQGRSGRRKISPHHDSIPDRPARIQSLCRLSYPAHLILKQQVVNIVTTCYENLSPCWRNIRPKFGFCPSKSVHRFQISPHVQTTLTS